MLAEWRITIPSRKSKRMHLNSRSAGKLSPAMPCPRLDDLPEPLSGKFGWPWTEESTPSGQRMLDGHEYPPVSIVTPSFNQGEFLEETIRSVLLQGYPNLEYLVIDGGSTDNSVDVIKKYSPWLSYWISQPDSGQSAAINLGLKLASGLFATWTNSDDMLCRNALVQHAQRVGFEPNRIYVGYCICIDQDGNLKSLHRGRVFSFEDLVRVGTVWRAENYRGHIDQPAVLFSRDLFNAIGGLNAENHSTMDYELWGELLLRGATCQYTDIPFGMFREHQEQKTYDTLRQTQSLVETAAALTRRANCLSEELKSEILAELEAYHCAFRKSHWRGTGRLARIGLPPRVVNPVRELRRRLQGIFDE